MFPNTPIAIIGGAGKSGKFVVQQLIQHNIPIRILLRRPAPHDFPIGQVVQGDVRDIDAVRHVCQGCKAIISTLGQAREEPPVFSQPTRNILAASEADWTLVRLPLIGLTENTAPIAISLEDCPGTGIFGMDLARFLIRQIDDRQYIRQAPFLANV